LVFSSIAEAILLGYSEVEDMSLSTVKTKPVPATTPATRSRCKRGQTLVEYTIVLAFISVLAVAVFAILGSRIVLVFSAIDNLLDTAQSSS
jgi:Flp pilus assembly pilin Flp